MVLLGGAGALLHVHDRGPDQQPARTPPGPSALVAGGFETDPTEVGWVLDPGTGAVSVTTTRARSGASSLQVEAGAAGRATSATSPPVAAVPGQTYSAGAFSLVSAGSQRLGLTFRDRHGRELTSRSSPTGATSGRWSRVLVAATAPVASASVTVNVSAASGSGSRVDWDDLILVDSAVTNGGFETPAADAACPVAWQCGESDGTQTKRVTFSPRSGSAALLLTDVSVDHDAWARSPLVPVSPSIGHTFTAWFLVTEGRPEPAMTVRWYNNEGSLIGDGDPPSRSSGTGSWVQIDATRTAPDTAAYASIDLSTGGAGTGEILWDDVTVAPSTGSSPRRWDPMPVARLDGFTTTTTSHVLDLRGRPKIVTIVSGDPATLQVADLQTGRVEHSSPLPGVVHGWGLTEGDDGRSVYVGTGGGHVARYDLVDERLTDLGRATPRAVTVFCLTTGPDGRIWGGSYPGGEVWSYDVTGGFRVLAPVGSGHDYARSIAVDNDWVYVGTGSTSPDIVRISVADPSRRTTIALPFPAGAGFVVTLDLHGRYLAARLPEGRRDVYDTVAHTWDVPLSRDTSGRELLQTPTSTATDAAPFYYFSEGLLWRVDPALAGAAAKRAIAAVSLPSARDRSVVRTRIGGTLADWILSYDGVDTVTALEVSALPTGEGGTPSANGAAALPRPLVRTFRLRLRPNAVPIKSLAIGSAGEVLVGGFGGSSLSELDPRDKDPRLIPLISDPIGKDAFGEVEGMVSNGHFDYFGSYTGARIFRRDSTQPWMDGENPRLLTTLGPTLGQDRPIAWATAGTRTVFGTIPQYGRLGGILGWFEGEATMPRTVWSPVADQSIVALTGGSGSVVYGGTSRWGGLGVAPATQTAEIFAYDVGSSAVLWRTAPLEGAQAFAAVAAADGRLWAATRTTLVELDPDNGTVLRRIPLLPGVEPDNPTYRSVDLAVVDGQVIVASQGGLHSVDVETLTLTTIAATGVVPSRVRAVGGALYFPSRSVLLRTMPR